MRERRSCEVPKGPRQQAQARAKGSAVSSASRADPAHTSRWTDSTFFLLTGMRKMRPLTYRVLPCLQIHAGSHRALLCKTLSYLKSDTAGASCSQSTQNLTHGLFFFLTLQKHGIQRLIPRLAYIFSTQSPTLGTSKMAQWLKALADAKPEFNPWDSLWLKVRIPSASRLPHECYGTYTRPQPQNT